MRMSIWGIVFALTLLAPASRAFCSSPERGGVGIGGPSPPFEASDLSGGKVSLRKITGSGEAVVVNFWGLRCDSCLQEIPHLNRLQDKFRGRVRFLGINVDGAGADVLKAQIEKMKLKIDFSVVPDPDFVVSDSFKMMLSPLTVVIDAGGIVRYRHEGYKEGDEELIDKAVSGIAPDTRALSR